MTRDGRIPCLQNPSWISSCKMCELHIKAGQFTFWGAPFSSLLFSTAERVSAAAPGGVPRGSRAINGWNAMFADSALFVASDRLPAGERAAPAARPRPDAAARGGDAPAARSLRSRCAASSFGASR